MPRWEPRKLTPAQQALVIQFKPLAHRIALEWHNRLRSMSITYGIDQDAWESEACLGLIKAALAFDPNRGIKFMTYAYKAIKNTLLHLWERRRERPAQANSWQFDELDDQIEDAATSVEHDELRRVMWELLTPRECQMLMLLYRDGLGLREIGLVFGISKERVRQINLRSCELLRIALTR